MVSASARATASLGRQSIRRWCGLPQGRHHGTLADALRAQDPKALALLSPPRGVRWTYADVGGRVSRLATALARHGYREGDIVATDLASVPENFLLQLACSHLGAAVVTLKSPANLATLRKELSIRGSVSSGAGSFLGGEDFDLAEISVEPSSGRLSFQEACEAVAGTSPPPNAGSGDSPLGFYGSAKAVTNAQALSAGGAAKERLGMTSRDIVLVSITLNHLFGIGSAVSAALQSGAAVVLPEASGIVGCGDPSQRAQVTRGCLEFEKCSLLFADTHTLKALQAADPAPLESLRGGVCKVGSGTAFLGETTQYVGVALELMGKA